MTKSQAKNDVVNEAVKQALLNLLRDGDPEIIEQIKLLTAEQTQKTSKNVSMSDTVKGSDISSDGGSGSRQSKSITLEEVDEALRQVGLEVTEKTGGRRTYRKKKDYPDSSKSAWAGANRPEDEQRVEIWIPKNVLAVLDGLRAGSATRKAWIVQAIAEKIQKDSLSVDNRPEP